MDLSTFPHLHRPRPSSPNHMSLITLYFPDEVDEHGIFAKIGDMVDGTVPHDKYIEEMLVISMSQIDEIVHSLSLLHHLIFLGCPPSRLLRRSRLLCLWSFERML